MLLLILCDPRRADFSKYLNGYKHLKVRYFYGGFVDWNGRHRQTWSFGLLRALRSDDKKTKQWANWRCVTKACCGDAMRCEILRCATVKEWQRISSQRCVRLSQMRVFLVGAREVSHYDCHDASGSLSSSVSHVEQKKVNVTSAATWFHLDGAAVAFQQSQSHRAQLVVLLRNFPGVYELQFNLHACAGNTHLRIRWMNWRITIGITKHNTAQCAMRSIEDQHNKHP